MSQELAWIPASVAPHVKRLADAIGEHVEATMRDAIDRAIAALAPTQHAATENTHGDPDRRDDDPVPHVQGGAGRELHGDGARGQGAAAVVDRRGERADRLVAADPLTPVIGPQLVAMMTPAPIAHRDIKPDNTSHGKPRQRAVMRCKKCGKLGSRSDGCGTSHQPENNSDDGGKLGSGQSEPHETQQGASTPGQRASVAAGNVADSHGAPIGHRSAGPSSSTYSEPLTAIEPPPSKSRHLKPTAAAVAEAKERIARKNEIAARAASATAASRAPSRVDDNPTAHERWTASEIAVETSQAELYKPDGALPAPSSSWDITPRAGDGGLPFAVRINAA